LRAGPSAHKQVGPLGEEFYLGSRRHDLSIEFLGLRGWAGGHFRGAGRDRDGTLS
jgi:hypothetical protein